MLTYTSLELERDINKSPLDSDVKRQIFWTAIVNSLNTQSIQQEIIRGNLLKVVQYAGIPWYKSRFLQIFWFGNYLIFFTESKLKFYNSFIEMNSFLFYNSCLNQLNSFNSDKWKSLPNDSIAIIISRLFDNIQFHKDLVDLDCITNLSRKVIDNRKLWNNEKIITSICNQNLEDQVLSSIVANQLM